MTLVKHPEAEKVTPRPIMINEALIFAFYHAQYILAHQDNVKSNEIRVVFVSGKERNKILSSGGYINSETFRGLEQNCNYVNTLLVGGEILNAFENMRCDYRIVEITLNNYRGNSWSVSVTHESPKDNFTRWHVEHNPQPQYRLRRIEAYDNCHVKELMEEHVLISSMVLQDNTKRMPLNVNADDRTFSNWVKDWYHEDVAVANQLYRRMKQILRAKALSIPGAFFNLLVENNKQFFVDGKEVKLNFPKVGLQIDVREPLEMLNMLLERKLDQLVRFDLDDDDYICNDVIYHPKDVLDSEELETLIGPDKVCLSVRKVTKPNQMFYVFKMGTRIPD